MSCKCSCSATTQILFEEILSLKKICFETLNTVKQQQEEIKAIKNHISKAKHDDDEQSLKNCNIKEKKTVNDPIEGSLQRTENEKTTESLPMPSQNAKNNEPLQSTDKIDKDKILYLDGNFQKVSLLCPKPDVQTFLVSQACNARVALTEWQSNAERFNFIDNGILYFLETQIYNARIALKKWQSKTLTKAIKIIIADGNAINGNATTSKQDQSDSEGEGDTETEDETYTDDDTDNEFYGP